MYISATEFKNNFGKYLLLAKAEDIYITKNGKLVARLTNPYKENAELVQSLYGIIPVEITMEEAKKERLNSI